MKGKLTKIAQGKIRKVVKREGLAIIGDRLIEKDAECPDRPPYWALIIEGDNNNVAPNKIGFDND